VGKLECYTRRAAACRKEERTMMGGTLTGGVPSPRAAFSSRVAELDLEIAQAKRMVDGLRDKILGAGPQQGALVKEDDPSLTELGYDRVVDRMLARIKALNETLGGLHGEL
jgi:hypothetical protein